jgi:hypothetical protein
MSNTIQLGSFLFSEVEGAPDKVFIQIAGDGEGGYFDWVKVHFHVRSAYNIVTELEIPLTTDDHAIIDDLMWEFWGKHF